METSTLGSFVILALWAGAILIWIWALVDILKSDFRNNVDKVIWLLVVFFLPFFGVILYYFIGRGQKA